MNLEQAMEMAGQAEEKNFGSIGDKQEEYMGFL